jgi:adenosylmethionine-8-amino-7-oxononanoate aminotransferase
MTYQNYSLAQLQQIDAAHHLHPFTDHKDLRAAGTRVIVRGEGPFIYDSEGNEILDGMAGLWCVNVGYGRHELAEAAYAQMKELPFYNSFFRCSTPTPGQSLTYCRSIRRAPSSPCQRRRSVRAVTAPPFPRGTRYRPAP